MGLLTVGRREHTDPGKLFPMHENRNGSKEASSESEIGRIGGKEVKTWSISKSDWGSRQRAGWRRWQSCRSHLASRGPGWRGKGEAGSIPPEQRGLVAPHPQAPKEMLEGMCPFYNFILFTTSMKFFKIHTWCSGKEAKAVWSFDAPLCMLWAAAPLQRGATTVDFSAFPCRKGAPGTQAEQHGISYVHWFLPQKEGLYFFHN